MALFLSAWPWFPPQPGNCLEGHGLLGRDRWNPDHSRSLQNKVTLMTATAIGCRPIAAGMLFTTENSSKTALPQCRLPSSVSHLSMHLELVLCVCVTLESAAHFCALEFTCFFINILSKWLKKLLWRLFLKEREKRKTLPGLM